MARTVSTPQAAAKGPFVRLGDVFFKYRNFVFPAVLLALMAGFAPVPLMGDPAADVWLDGCGIATAALGSGFRIWVIGLAYIKRGGLDKKVHADTLVTGGMFAVCRNPLYVGNALVLLGLMVVHNHPAVYAVGVPFFALAYGSIVAAEEHFLRRKFGAEFDDYCRAVNRFWPDFSHYRAGTRGMAYNWRRPVMKDYSSIYVWIAVSMVLIADEHVAWGLWAPSLATLWPTMLAIAVATAAMAVVRTLKKSGLLHE